MRRQFQGLVIAIMTAVTALIVGILMTGHLYLSLVVALITALIMVLARFLPFVR
ncbi:MAG: hypothetical protein PW790_02270 [Parvibaculaceae bacterium]|nr:hypothetical protein [Parvibaculaceae bacterium]